MSRAPAPLVVVGSGMAGLSVALAAAPRPVVLIGRAPDGLDSATALAQGGIAVAMAPGDSTAAHACDTLAAGVGLNDFLAVLRLVEQAPAAVRWLQALGVEFDREGERLQLGREGGHLQNRIVHAGGDASGARLLEALAIAARQATHIDWRTPCEVDGLLLRGTHVSGVRIRDQDGRHELIRAHDVVLATGGIGALFSATTNPSGADGNGIALAIAAGAQPRDLEFVQFHPTAIAVDSHDALPLATEALRGAGARLRDDHGDAIMDGVHPLADLAPRDVVARRVWQLLDGGTRVWLDCTDIGDAWPQRFPTVHATCQRIGIDPRRAFIPVTPAAHFHMGGIAVDDEGATSVAGLHAVGEVACNRVHGANRLASNSLLEGIVFGQRLGQRLRDARPHQPRRGAGQLVTRGRSADPDALRELRRLTWRSLGPVRDGATLRAALQRITSEPTLGIHWQGRLVTMMLEAALRRRSSLGAHFRSDAAETFGLAQSADDACRDALRPRAQAS